MYEQARAVARDHMNARVRSFISTPYYLLQYSIGAALVRRANKRPVLAGTELALPTSPVGPSHLPRRMCKICDEEDWVDDEWLDLFDELGVGEMRERKHRKGWEWAQGVYALRRLGVLREDAICLGVGAGSEQPLYYLTNAVGMVYATDIYGSGEFAESTAFADMLTNPERYARIPFRPDHLNVMHMDGRHLNFPDDYFDFAFSFSSIEHFGGHAGAAAAIREMGRVIKPGGVVVITTELIVNGVPRPDYFLPEELQQDCLHDCGLRLIEDIDYRLSPMTLAHALDCRHPSYRTAAPHIILKFRHVAWTSICLILEKPATS